jgi:DNA-binding MarR family transcriptional regulator
MPDSDRTGGHLDELRDALAQTSFTLMAVLTEVAAEHDLSLTQLRVLGILRAREPTMAQLANRRPARPSLGAGHADRVGS